MNEIKSALTDYAEAFTSRESKVLQDLREYCYSHYEDSAMLSGFYQGRLLAMLSRMIRPKVVLEIGTYLGYSALCFAEGLAEGGKVITLDILEETSKVARSFVERTEFKHRIDFRLGQATEIIPTLGETLDLVFIDADKPNYSNYYNLVFDKLRPGGFIIADNVLWSGKVLDPGDDENAKALADFNNMILADDRVSNVLLPIRDGLMVARKQKPLFMAHNDSFEFVYLDSTGFRAYELTDDEKEWLISEDRPLEFWLQRRPVFGKYGGYVRRDELTSDIEILPPRSHHGDRSHPLPFV